MKKDNYSDEFKENTTKHVQSKFEYDLYHEEDNIIMPVIRVKRIKLPNNGEKWKIFENDKIIFTIEGIKLLKKEKKFLHTLDGINFLISEFKKGINSFNALHKALKLKIKSLNS